MGLLRALFVFLVLGRARDCTDDCFVSLPLHSL